MSLRTTGHFIRPQDTAMRLSLFDSWKSPRFFYHFIWAHSYFLNNFGCGNTLHRSSSEWNGNRSSISSQRIDEFTYFSSRKKSERGRLTYSTTKSLAIYIIILFELRIAIRLLPQWADYWFVQWAFGSYIVYLSISKQFKLKGTNSNFPPADIRHLHPLADELLNLSMCKLCKMPTAMHI